jgi:hypothetical protein
MSAWWTYRLTDFLLIAPRTNNNLFELYNVDIWPVQVATLALGVAILALAWRGGAGSGRIVAAVLAVLWLWVAWAFHAGRYATINWAAAYFAAGFVLQALVLAWTGAVRGRLTFSASRSLVKRSGLGIFLVALVLQPLVAPLVGRPWTQAELFGAAPDPTAVATLGVLLAADRALWELLAIPLVWCAISGATLWTMDSPEAFVVPLLALIASALAIAQARTPGAQGRKP